MHLVEFYCNEKISKFANILIHTSANYSQYLYNLLLKLINF